MDFTERFSRCQPRLYAVAFSMLGNDADASDAVQEGFINAFTHLDSCQELASFEAWLVQVVGNAAREIRRKKYSFLARKRAEEAYERARHKKRVVTPAGEVDGEELAEAIRGILERTTDRRQQICAMWCKGRTPEQIAEKLNVSVATVRREWMKVKTFLRDKLPRLGWSKV